MKTPHINTNGKKFCETVLMPGDPLRAKFIAKKYLKNTEEINTVRNILAYNGEYKGKKVSIMASGMGQPSMGIYSYELYNFFNVDNIIRIGSCGSYSEKVKIKDIILVQGASTDSNFASQYNLEGNFCALSNWELLKKSVELAEEKKIIYHVGNILSSDIFYRRNSKEFVEKWREMGVLAVEMESAALFMNANYLKKKAHCILTVSDSLITEESLSSSERENSFLEMCELSLDLASTL